MISFFYIFFIFILSPMIAYLPLNMKCSYFDYHCFLFLCCLIYHIKIFLMILMILGLEFLVKFIYIYPIIIVICTARLTIHLKC